MSKIILFVFLLCAQFLVAQFAPPAGQSGSTAIYKDSSVFIGWATGCNIVRGYQDISDPSLGFASVGDSTFATGIAGSNGVVSLGDGGTAILQFAASVKDGPGFDFAVFENSFSDDYLELAVVEVSSDGMNFFRFPSTSYTQDSVQLGPFDLLDATKLNNVAGKYRVNYGTPFDLSELSGTPGLDINNVTHVKIVDVVGSLDSSFATNDQYGKKINDPWPTPFPSSGFDLDAVGVIHQNPVGFSESVSDIASFFVNASGKDLSVHGSAQTSTESVLRMTDLSGRTIFEEEILLQPGEFSFSLGSVPASGVYVVSLTSTFGTEAKKIFIP